MENAMGMDLVQSLREWLIANKGMNLKEAQEVAIDFSSYYLCSDWITLTNHKGEWKTFKA